MRVTTSTSRRHIDPHLARRRARRALAWLVAVVLSLFASSALTPLVAVAAPVAELAPIEDPQDEVEIEARAALVERDATPRSAPPRPRVVARPPGHARPAVVPAPPLAATRFIRPQRKTLLRLHV
ncbi:MAG: hypothetical protein U0414_12270 [Polyangiaceae bacterium]